jgi:1-acyl-sn-glycerol-3-phosphate acyltransferase
MTMTIDGFADQDKEAFVGFSPSDAERLYALINTVSRLLHVEFAGLSNLPKGRTLLVANHAFGWDMAFPMAEIRRQTDRTVWALGEHLWWKVPVLRRLVASMGVVDGTPANIDQLLTAEQLVVVLPGGLRESLKPRELRYRLLWGHRYGFVRAAIRNRTPVCPLAAIGSDELFDLVGDAYARGKRWLGRFAVPIPLPARLLPIPHRVHLRYVVGDPIELPAAPAEANDPEVLRRCRHLIEGALQELIDTELARRLGWTL